MKIGTHDGKFHADEVFSIAVLLECYPEAKVIRTRDEEQLVACDMRVDVGRKYDPDTGDYDHHQGGLVRENGIQYSSFGLVWNDFGPVVTENEGRARYIDRTLVQVIDAADNGQKLVEPVSCFGGVRSFDIGNVISAFNPCWDEVDRDPDEAFFEAVEFARQTLLRLIKRAESNWKAKERIRQAIARAKDPRIVVFDQKYPWEATVVREAPQAIFVILPDTGGRWRVECVPQTLGTFTYRKSLPTTWSGLDKEAFAAVTGVTDAFFVHHKLFVCVAESLEGALALAYLALEI